MKTRDLLLLSIGGFFLYKKVFKPASDSVNNILEIPQKIVSGATDTAQQIANQVTGVIVPGSNTDYNASGQAVTYSNPYDISKGFQSEPFIYTSSLAGARETASTSLKTINTEEQLNMVLNKIISVKGELSASDRQAVYDTYKFGTDLEHLLPFKEENSFLKDFKWF